MTQQPLGAGRFSICCRAVMALIFSTVISVRLPAQVVGATLSGTVKDQSGALLPNAQISVSNVATGVTRTLTTDAAGFYSAPNLLAGTYEVTATAPGFASAEQTGVTLTVGAQQVLNLTLKVGRTTEKFRSRARRQPCNWPLPVSAQL